MTDPKKQAENQLREIATKAGVTIREIYQLVNKVYIDEENLQKRLYDLKNAEMQNRQLMLYDLQMKNEGLNNKILVFKLMRKERNINRIEKFNSFIQKLKPWKKKNVTSNLSKQANLSTEA
jgi:hypothetical protein